MEIIQIINSKSSEDYSFEPSNKVEKQESIQLLENEFKTNLPSDYKTILLKYGPCSIEGVDSSIYMVSIDEIFHKLDKQFYNELKSALIIGSDGGGSYYFYDTNNSLGKGINAIFLADRGRATIKDAYFVADSFASLVMSFQKGA